MYRSFSRGAVAALLSVATALPAAAQVVVGGSRLPADSVFFRTFGVGKLDTIIVLWRALDREPYGSSTWLELTRKIDSLMPGSPRMLLRQPGRGPLADLPVTMPQGWMGFNVQGPVAYAFDRDGDYVTYFAYPSILSVDPESPADRAGIVPGDVLMAFNGTDVVGHRFNLRRLVVPDTKVAVTIRRDGETKDYSLDIVKAPQGVFDRRLELLRAPALARAEAGVIRVDPDRDDGDARARTLRPSTVGRGGVERPVRSRVVVGSMAAGGYMVIAPHAVFGADVSTVSADLARVLKLDKGVLVNDVPATSPAHRAGLRAGDVIIAAAGQAIAGLGQLQDLVVSQLGERSVALQVMRNHKPVKIIVTW